MKHIYLIAAALILSFTGFSNKGEPDACKVGNKQTANAVRFMTFGAQQKQQGIISLTWTTGKLENASHFKIERSEDGLSWNTIALAFPRENPENINKYNYTHKTRNKVSAYYRIRMIDKDGNSNYSAVKLLSPGKKSSETFVYTEEKNAASEISRSTESVMMRLLNNNVL